MRSPSRTSTATEPGISPSGNPRVLVLAGQGNGTFTQQPVAGQIVDLRRIAIADFNGDGDGTFGPPLGFTTFISPTQNVGGQSVVAGDFNADGRVDLAVVNRTSPAQLSILLNDASYPPPEAATGPSSAVTTTGATVQGTVTPHGQGTTFKFLASASFSRTWRRSRVKGTLTLSGESRAAGGLTVKLVRAGDKKATTTRTVQIGAGSFTVEILLPATALPGKYAVDAALGGTPAASATTAAELTPPPEGVVRRAYVSTSPGGSPVRKLRRPGILFGVFQFAARPSKGRVLTIAWIDPSDHEIDRVRKGFRPVVISFVGTPGGPLEPGRWRAVLRAGKTIVSIVSVTVT